MLQNHTARGKDKTLMEHGYLISVQAESRVDPEVVRLKLADTLKWVEGVGEVEVTYMGDISMSVDDVDLEKLASGGTD